MDNKWPHVTGITLAMCIFALGGNAEDSASSMKSILLPTTSNDFSGMIYSLLQQQSSFVASQQGASDESHPLNMLAAMSDWAQQTQAALFEMAPPVSVEGNNITNLLTAGLGSSLTDLPDPLGMFLNQSDAWANTVAGSHVDPVPNSLVNLLIENPLGPQLDAALKSLPSIQDPIGKANASASFGSAFSRAAPGLPAYFQKGGANVPVNQAAQVLSYRPCIVSDGATGINVNPALIVVNPRLISSSILGVNIQPELIQVQPDLIKVKPVGVNVSPTGIQVYPRFINIGPQVTVGYPATPPPAKMSTSPKTGSNGSLTNGAAPTGRAQGTTAASNQVTGK